MKMLDIAVIGTDERFRKRVADLATEFEYSFEHFDSSDEFFGIAESYKSIQFIIIYSVDVDHPATIAGYVQVAKQVANDSYILSVVGSKLNPEDTRSVKKSGASLVMMENEFFTTSKLEFITTQTLRSSFIPIKVTDILPNTAPAFAVYHLMPLNKKFLPLTRPGTVFDAAKLERLKEANEIYIKRDDLNKYDEYLSSLNDSSTNGMARRCRAQFLKMNHSFVELVMMLSDQSTYASFDEGKALYEKCQFFATDLLNALGSLPKPWEVINLSAIGDFGSLERSPAISAYCGILSLNTNIGDPVEIMVGAMMTDIGFVMLSPSVTRKIRQDKMSEFNGEELQEYQKHPIYSLNQCLSRKLPFTDKIKEMILCSHERADKTGFPNRPMPEKIPDEAYMVQICEDLDKFTQVKMGKEKISIVDAKKAIYEKEFNSMKRYSVSFITRIQKEMMSET